MKLFFILIIVLLCYLYCMENDSFIHSNHVKNPDKHYWINRVDGSGNHDYSNDHYLTLSITPFHTNQCSARSECKELNVNCLQGNCVPYSNAEIYNSTCCESIEDLPVDPNNKLSQLRKNLLHSVCQSNLLQNCKLTYTPTLTLDDPFTQTEQAIKDTVINAPYLYSYVKQTIRCKNLKDGSRGFGFWNTSVDFKNTGIAWFIQLSSGDKNDGFYIHCQKPMTDKLNMNLVKIKDLDEEEHEYTIDWKKDSIDFYMDDELVHTETQNVPSIPMAYHNWVDNSVFDYDKSGNLIHLIQNLKEEKSNIIKSLEIIS